MQYIEYIEASKKWTCPKTGLWKVICIGGGGSGSGHWTVNSKESTIYGNAGSSTSFGSYLSAKGGAAGTTYGALSAPSESNALTGAPGINGYNGAVTYGSLGNAATTGIGYGASGGFGVDNALNRVTVHGAHPGYPGELKTTILEISKDEAIACTIGARGEAGTKAEGVYGCSSYPGNSGVIIVQYLGESI